MYIFVQLILFKLLENNEYNEFKIYLDSNHEVGDIEPNSGEIRKVL